MEKNISWILFCIIMLNIISFLPTLNVFATSSNSNNNFMLAIEAPVSGSIPISSKEELKKIGTTTEYKLNGNYHLTNNIDLSNETWLPIGVSTDPFVGIFDGQGYVISNFIISSPTNYYPNTGLFGYISKASILYLGVENTTYGVCTSATGAICGYAMDSNIKNCYNKGNINASNNTVASSSGFYIGGICGINGRGIIEYCYNSGNMSCIYTTSIGIGGIVGFNASGTISNCFNTGNISINYNTNSSTFYSIEAGGICSLTSGGTSTANDSSTIYHDALISNCFNTGNIEVISTKNAIVGGITAQNGGVSASSTISNCYNVGNISASNISSMIGGIASSNPYFNNSINNCYWNIDSIQQINNTNLTNKKGVGSGNDTTSRLTTEQMKHQSSFVGFDFYTTWTIKNGVNKGYPILKSLLTNNEDNENSEDNIDEDDKHGIDYDGVEAVTITGVTFSFKSGKTIPDDATTDPRAIINLTVETLILNDFTIQAYSIDGGVTWKEGTLTQAMFVKLLDKDLELWLCYKDYNKKAKKPQGSGDDHNVIAFPKINKRPIVPTLVINYSIGADIADETGDFLLTTKNGTEAVKEDIQIGVMDTASKKLDENGYGKFYDGTTNGVPLKELTSGKITKTLYFIRTAPKHDGSIYTAASKPKKITVYGVRKPTNYKVNYNKEIIKLNKNDSYSIDGGKSFITVTAVRSIYLDLSELITSGAPVQIKRSATAKRAATESQIITPVSRLELSSAILPCASGKMTLDTKKYEVYNPNTKKWGGIPKITANTELDIRLKSTAKLRKGVLSGNASSLSGKLKITWGEYAKDAKGNSKNGIIEAKIVP